MIVQDVLEEVITLPEAVDLAEEIGYSLDRSNLARYAQNGRLVARKSRGTWLTTRSALQALIVELAGEQRGRPRPQIPAWAQVELTPDLLGSLKAIDEQVADLAAHSRAPDEQDHVQRELIVEAIYHSNRIEGNHLSLPEVCSLVKAFWATQEEDVHDAEQASNSSRPERR